MNKGDVTHTSDPESGKPLEGIEPQSQRKRRITSNEEESGSKDAKVGSPMRSDIEGKEKPPSTKTAWFDTMARSSINRTALRPLASATERLGKPSEGQAAKEEVHQRQASEGPQQNREQNQEQKSDGKKEPPKGASGDQETGPTQLPKEEDDRPTSMEGMNADAHLAEVMDRLVLQDKARKDGWEKAKRGQKGTSHMDSQFAEEQKHWEAGQAAYTTSQQDLELRNLPRLYTPPMNCGATEDYRWAKFYEAHPGLARNCIGAKLCFLNSNETDIETWVAEKIEGGLLGIHPHTNHKLHLKTEALAKK